MTGVIPVSRREYHAEYYERTAVRRRLLASHRRQMKRWAQWLIREVLAELARPTQVIVPVPYPVRRPLLILGNRS